MKLGECPTRWFLRVMHSRRWRWQNGWHRWQFVWRRKNAPADTAPAAGKRWQAVIRILCGWVAVKLDGPSIKKRFLSYMSMSKVKSYMCIVRLYINNFGMQCVKIY